MRLLADKGLRPPTESYLTQAGLPDLQKPIRFYADGKGVESANYEGARYLVIGDDFGTKISVRAQDDRVYSVDLDQRELPLKFVNTSIQDLLLCLAAYLAELPRIQNASEDEIGALMAEVRARVTDIDPAALGGVDNWWSQLLEEVEHGLG